MDETVFWTVVLILAFFTQGMTVWVVKHYLDRIRKDIDVSFLHRWLCGQLVASSVAIGLVVEGKYSWFKLPVNLEPTTHVLGWVVVFVSLAVTPIFLLAFTELCFPPKLDEDHPESSVAR